MLKTRLTDLLGIRYPIISAPMVRMSGGLLARSRQLAVWEPSVGLRRSRPSRTQHPRADRSHPVHDRPAVWCRLHHAGARRSATEFRNSPGIKNCLLCYFRNSPGPERGRLDHQASCGQGMLVLSFTIELAEILIDMTSAARFEGVGGSRSVQPVLEGRTNCAAAGARGAHCRVGAPSWVE